MITTISTTEFAQAVRAALADLPPDDIDELTDGLEADLAERMHETGDESGSDLGDPVAYAEELRAAAGYPPRSARSHLGDTLPNLRTLPQELRRRWDGHLSRHAWLRSTVGFLITLRPVWWVLRGVVAYALATSFLGINGVAWWPIAVGFVIVSVQLGRGWMQGRAGVRWILRAVSAVVIIATPFVVQWTLDRWTNAAYYEMADQTYYPQGLTLDGNPVANIYAYDAAGDPIDQVQLYDQNGNPLNAVSSGDLSSPYMDAQDGSGAMLVPSGDVAGRAGWNVYPLSHVNDWSDYEDDGKIDDSEISSAQFPFATVKPLAGHETPAAPVGEVTTAPAG